MRIATIAMVLVPSLATTGCASIVSGVNQSIAVQTRLDGEALSGAACRLSNSKGTWFVTTPGSVTVHRGFQALDVECTKEGAPAGLAQFASSTKAMAFGNILFGGVIGVGVDVGTGAAYDYPELLSIDMGRSIVLPSAGDAALAAKSAAPSRLPASASSTAADSTTPPPYPGRYPPIVPAGVASGTPENVPPIQARKPPAVPLGLASGAPEWVPTPALAPTVAGADTSPLRFRAYAETLARTRSCHPQPVAALSATGPLSETYTIACLSGEPMVARCEADECRELK